MAGGGHFAFRGYHQSASRNKEPNDFYGLADRAPIVVAQVEDEALHALLLHVENGVAHLASALVGELGQKEVAGMGCFVDDSIPRQAGLLDLPAGDLEGTLICLAWALHDKFESGAGLAAQVLANARGGPPFDVAPVYTYNNIACAHARLLSRTMLIGFLDDTAVEFLVGADECSDAGIAACGHAAQVVLVVVGEVDGIGVYLLQHPVDGPLDGGICRDGVDVEHVELAIDICEDFEVACDIETRLFFLLLG